MAVRRQVRGILRKMRGKKPTIQFIDAASGSTTISTMPAHQIGDLLVACVFRDGGTFTVPAGWTQVVTNGQGSYQQTLYYKFATSNAEVSGTWTSATDIIIAVYRGVDPINPFGGSSANTGSSGTLSRTAYTPTVMDGTSWFILCPAARVTTQTPSYSSNYTQRATRENSSATSELWFADNNGQTNIAGTTVPLGSILTGGQTCSILSAELKAHAA